MNKVILFVKKSVLLLCTLALLLGMVVIPATSVSAAEKNVYSFINDFPKAQGENGWRMYCGATTSFYDSAKESWTNKDTHQIPSSFKKNVITTCNNGGVSYIDFIAPKSGSISVIFKAKVTAPANDGGDGTYGGGLFGIHLSDPKRSNPNEADKQSSEPIFPAGLEAWFISGRYELQDGETLEIEEFIDIDKGQFVQFCFCSKGDPWKLDLQAFEVRYDGDESDSNNVSSSTTSNETVNSNTSSTVSGDKNANSSQKPSSSDSSDSDDKNNSVSDKTESNTSSGVADTSSNESSQDSTESNTTIGATDEDTDTEDSANTEPEKKSYTGLIVGISIGAVVLIGGIVAVFVICRKKGII